MGEGICAKSRDAGAPLGGRIERRELHLPINQHHGESPMADEHSSASPQITFDDFQRVDIRVGRVLSAAPLAGARKPAYTLRIDFGPEIGVKQSSAQLTARYCAEDLPGRLVLGVVNFPPRRIAGFKSEVLTLGVADADGAVILLAPDRDVPLGSRMF
jgi:tRNA-binding protein